MAASSRLASEPRRFAPPGRTMPPAAPRSTRRSCAIRWISFELEPPDEAEMARRIGDVRRQPRLAGRRGRRRARRLCLRLAAPRPRGLCQLVRRGGLRRSRRTRGGASAARSTPSCWRCSRKVPRRLRRHRAAQRRERRPARGDGLHARSASTARSAGRWAAGATSAGGSGCSSRLPHFAGARPGRSAARCASCAAACRTTGRKSPAHSRGSVRRAAAGPPAAAGSARHSGV